MHDTTASAKNDSANRIRDKFIHVGRDETGAIHCYDTVTETVHVVHPVSGREARVDLLATEGVTSIEDYIARVDREWDNLNFGLDVFVNRIAEACC
jgi:hypothetical protein